MESRRIRPLQLAIGASIAAASAVVVLPAMPVSAASITVDTTADTVDAAAGCTSVTLGLLPGTDGKISLREAVCAANNNAGADTITFSINGTFVLSGAANEDNGATGDLDIKGSLTISGNGPTNTIIDGNLNERIFDVFPSSAITFDVNSLAVQNGDTQSTSFKEGGAMYLHNNVTTTLTNVAVRNNYSGANGAIENRGTLSISTSTISGNLTVASSGSVVGGGLHTAGPTTITNSTIASNTVVGEGGGLAVSVGAGVTVQITGTTISNNTASVVGGGLGNGGGLSTTGNQGSITITNSTISGNGADNSGGGAHLSTPGAGTGNVTFTHVTIAENVADIDDNGSGSGGGIAQSNAAVTLENTIVARNGNSTTATRDDIVGTIVGSSAGNLVGDGTGMTGITDATNENRVGSGATPIDPLLAGLSNNGGPTSTHALAFASPAINTGSDARCETTDQRGTARPAGNCDIGAFEFTDSTPPDTTITATPANPSGSTSASFSFSGSDAAGGSGVASFECRLDGSSFAACTSPQTYTGLSEGSHTFDVRAIDGVGNPDTTPASYTWLIDTTRPDTTITSTPTNPSNSAAPSFSFSGSDGGSGVASFECRLDGGSYGPCTSPSSFTGVIDGPHTFDVRAIDALGNVDLTPASYTWLIDTAAPETAISSGPAALTTKTTATFAFSASDPDSAFTTTAAGSGVTRLECSLDGAAFATCTSPTTLTGLSNGAHTFRVRAVDGAGNTDATPAAVTWTVDTGAGPALRASKSVTGTFAVGGAITYTIVITNAGAIAQPDNAGDEMVDVLPASLQLVGATASGGTVTTDAGTRTVRWNGSLAPSATVTVTISAIIAESAAGQSITNQATVAFDADDDGTNESSAPSDDPAAAGASNATNIEVAAPAPTTTAPVTAPVPGRLPDTGAGHLRTSMTIALLLVLLGVSVIGVRRRLG